MTLKDLEEKRAEMQQQRQQAAAQVQAFDGALQMLALLIEQEKQALDPVGTPG